MSKHSSIVLFLNSTKVAAKQTLSSSLAKRWTESLGSQTDALSFHEKKIGMTQLTITF